MRLNPTQMALFAVLLSFLAGCNYYERKSISGQPVTEPTSGEPKTEEPTPEPIDDGKLTATFRSIQVNILEPKCVRCHSGPNAKAGLDFSTWESSMVSVEPGKPDESTFFAMVDWDEMPPRNPLPQEEKDAIYQWILDGALNN